MPALLYKKNTAKNHTRQETKKIYEEYKMEATIKNKMRLDKCDVYPEKETIGYRGENPTCQWQKEGLKKKQSTDQLLGFQ